MYHGSQTLGCEIEININYLSARYQIVLRRSKMHSLRISNYMYICYKLTIDS